ncbi:phage portal protein [Candidatus Saccharibacteria bacterium]|nr:phage portal protein [Candidatus Saccharibacteria bacterium]
MSDDNFYVSEHTKVRYPVANMTNFNTKVPNQLITAELGGLYGASVLQELHELIRLYHIYDHGADFSTEGSNGDYLPADLRFRKARQILDKEARFLFAKTPDMKVYSTDPSEEVKKAISEMQAFLDSVLKSNGFANKLVKAAKDCFIGRRVACFLNFSDDGIAVQFSPSMEFIYDVDPSDMNKLTKIVAFYLTNDSNDKREQRVYRKRYWMAEDGLCWFDEGLFDGLGDLVEVYYPATPTRFKYIPAVVILNDGLTDDLRGSSEIELLMESESWYSRLSNADIDSGRQNMNPVRWGIDLNPTTTKGLSIAPGSFWDLQSDMNSTADKVAGKVGLLESGMNYTAALKETLERIKGDMYDTVDMPDIRLMDFKVASGKALMAIYWGLIVRCDEKMHAWRPALEFIIQCIMDGAKLYPNSAKKYMPKGGMTVLDDGLYMPVVENQYPLPEDEAAEKQVDVLEVTSGVMSRKRYMRKWLGLTDAEADAELEQIKKEKEAFGEGQNNAEAEVLPGGSVEDNVKRNDNKSKNSQRQDEGKNNPVKER